jgi:hypothetical protein
MAKKFATEKETPYTRWVKSEGLEIESAIYQLEPAHVELKPWPRARRQGRLPQPRRVAHLQRRLRVRDPAGQAARARSASSSRRWSTSSTGAARPRVWNDAGAKITFEWKKGAIFAIPLNASHQHFNASGKEPARFVSVTNAPAIINAFGDLDFVFGTKYDFRDRFSGEPDYFANKGEQKGCCWTPTSWPTRSTCRSSPPRSAARAAGTSASTWPRAR